MAEGKGKEVNMVDFNGRVPHKRQRLEAWELQCVCFPPTEKDPLSNPLVVEATVGTLQTSRAYIDTGAATEIMFEKFFNRLSNEERSSEGQKERVQPLTFVVINIPSNYDVIIGRSGQCAFYMAVSVGHGTVKFPTERGIATLQPTQEAYMVEGESSKSEEDKQRLIIKPKYPEQRIRCPEDMTGIPRSISEHELKIPPNVKPVVQKKRSLEPERSLATCQEVEKLVSAGIL
ncbi:uncharacterized protein LOC110866602 [Helianthus annuus]|uniref:uncharacterized protein LOC110866602 n=1 Tax=Helianthus annuus TaxID=4232 RepID=UPI000B9021BE|nr:uncharacterized protein LOC110866602 [Helianthus annuus]